ncbi:DUF5700 domain-containing putative Zn-dependent protease [Mucilaginibacter segetis]|uniref:DUF2268 domain-containing protein n=1 Tax=Mucilaginibacter segetis TaxID=2793071 RepID=A0A934PUY6_9SPHI|nr:DUF5700 domain-containing putative Zn-dependent protease [Mucilaginibacter segetis]MBK0381318.1 hypothetical protein [Mucilaginibacter segetis]
MDRKLLAMMLFLLASITGYAATGLHIEVDLESAKTNVYLLERHSVTDKQLNEAAGLYGNQQLIAKVKSYSGAGRDVFISTLKEMITTGKIMGDDPYNWRGVKVALPEISSLLRDISQNKAAMLKDIMTMLAPYTPATLDVSVKACFLAGGGALGFTMGKEATFNVALQKLNGDIDATKLLVAHELYHIVQDAGQKKRMPLAWEKPAYYQEASAALLENLWSEGTANLVGDFAGFKANSPFARDQVAEWQKNADRRRENFTLFEAILYKCYSDTTTERYEQYYNVCFTTAYDESSYFVGYEMAKAIQKYRGKEALATFVTADPITFIKTYLDICHENAEDKKLVRFDAATEAIVERLLKLRSGKG